MKLADLKIFLRLKKDGFDRGIDGAKKKINTFSSSVKKIGGFIAGAFAAERILAFGKELLELGGIAEGVENAFNRIADRNTLRDLEKATAGTVSQLELMKRAVSAQNLGLPVENLASLFEFATKRAQDTGESVDYLVNSIVTGIGRKSPLILDNLGISAIQLREKLKGVGLESASVADVAAAVGEIAADSMRESGGVIETNAIKLQQLNKSWEDFKKTLATDETTQTFMSRLLREAQDFINLTTKFQTTKQVEEEQKARDEAAKKREEQIKMQTELFNLFGKSVNDATQEELDAATKAAAAQWEAIKAEKERGKTIAEIKEETKALKETLDGYGVNQTEEIQNTLKQIDANEKLIESLTTLQHERKNISMTAISGITPDYGSIFASPELDTSVLANMDSFRKKLKETYDKLLYEQGEFNRALNAAIESGIEDTVIGIADALGAAIGSGDWSGFGSAVLEAIGGFMQQLGALMIVYAINAALFAESVKNPLAWPLALAAGVAMVAAGAAVSSFAAGGLGGGSAGASGYSPSGSSASTAISGNVSFVLEGDKLIGAINNNRSRRRITR